MGCSPWGRKESDTTEQLHFHFSLHALEKELATHSSVLAWRVPGMEEPGGLPSMGSHRVGHDWSDLAAAAAAGTVYLPFPVLTSPRPRHLWQIELVSDSLLLSNALWVDMIALVPWQQNAFQARPCDWIWPLGLVGFWRRERQPTPVFLSGQSHGQRSLAGYSPRGHRVGHDWD